MTLVKEFRSLSQEHERTGSKKVLREKTQRYEERCRLRSGGEGCNANQTRPDAQCGEGTVWSPVLSNMVAASHVRLFK